MPENPARLNVINPHNHENGHNAQKDVQFENAVARTRWETLAESALYERSGRVTQYVQQLVDHMAGLVDNSGKSHYTAYVYHGQPNAFAIPDGSIFLSDGLIELVDTEEELFGGVRHELKHIIGDHSEHQMEAAKAGNQKLAIGRSRLHEWEADIRAFDELADMGINPLGEIELLSKLRKFHGKGGGDLAHGRTSDRIINLRLMTYLRDMESVDNPMHDIPAGIRQALSEEKVRVRSAYTDLLRSSSNRDYDLFRDSLRRASGDQALLALPDLIQKQRELDTIPVASIRLWKQQHKEGIQQLGLKAWSDFFREGSSLQSLSNQQKSLLFSSVLAMGFDSRFVTERNQAILFGQQNGERPPAADWTINRRGFLSMLRAQEDAEELLSVLSPETIAATGIKLDANPQQFIESVLKRTYDEYMFHDEDDVFQPDAYVNFVQQLTDRVVSLYQIHGTESHTSVGILRDVRNHLDKIIDGEEERTQIHGKLSVFFEEEVRERISEEAGELIALFDRFAHDPNGLSHTQEYREKVAEILAKEITDDPNTLLITLGKAKTAIEVPTMTIGIEEKLKQWVDNVIGEVLMENEKIDQYFSSDVEKALYRIKTALLCTPLGASEIDFFNIHSLQPLRDALAAERSSFDQLQTVLRYLTNPQIIQDEIGMPVDVVTVQESDSSDVIAQAMIYDFLKRQLAQGASKEDIGHYIEQLTDEFPLDYSSAYYDGTAKEEVLMVSTKDEVLHEIFQRFSFDLENAEDLQFLYSLSFMIEDINASLQIQDTALKRLVEKMTFSGALSFIEHEMAQGRIRSLSTIQTLVEERAGTHDEIREVRRVLFEFLTEDNGASLFANMVLAEQGTELILGRNRVDFLKAAIGNGKDDRMMKEYLYNTWVRVYEMNPDLTYGLQMDQVYTRLTRLNAQARYALVRDLLIAPHGLLTDASPRQKREFVDYFVDNFVTAEDKTETAIKETMREVMHELMITARYDLLYFAISPILQDKILQTDTQVPWEDIIRQSTPPSSFGDNVTEIEAEYDEEGQLIKEESAIIRPSEKSIREILSFFFQREPEAETEAEESVTALTRRALEHRSTYEGNILELFSLSDKSEKVQLTAVEFLKEIVQTLGAPGVRFLQLAGFYVDLPPKLAEEFSSVYDKVQGQSKITAHDTLMRNWEGFRDEVEWMGPAIGGGSEMTVFPIKHATHGETVVKVLNPNAAFHTRTSMELLRMVFGNLAKKDSRFELAPLVLDDIEEWITGDLTFTGFLPLDARFKAEHNGVTTPDNPYVIGVPNSYGPENPKFQHEEMIIGDNLTTPGFLEETEEGKQLVGLLVEDLFKQIQIGQVHSDIHPGNIRIAKNQRAGEVRGDVSYLLDRTNYLQLSFADQLFLLGLASSLENPSETTEMAIEYLEGQDIVIPDEAKTQIRQDVAQITGKDNMDRLMQINWALRKQKIRFPIRMTLLMKDFFYLDKMAKKVGFAGIEAAQQYVQAA